MNAAMQDSGRAVSPVRQDPVRVIFAADRRLFPVLGVAIASLARSSNPERRYLLTIISQDRDDLGKESLARCAGGRANISIDLIEPEIDLSGAQIDGGMHYSAAAAYFRLGIPETFADVDRVLYLDCDIVVERDISELFDLELDEHEEIAAAPAVGVIQAARRGRIIQHAGRMLPLSDYLRAWVAKDQLESYFNSGVVLFDLKKIREKKPEFRKEVMNLMANDYQMPDQDILNILFEGRVKLLPLKWNFQNPSLYYDDLPPHLLTDVEAAGAEPSIIHFVTERKPWNTPGVRRADKFWSCAADTPFAKELWDAFIAKAAPMAPPLSPMNLDGSVSVIVPVHNAAATLHEALSSALRQTALHEVVVVDDQSDDGSLAIAQAIAAEVPRLRVISLNSNFGAGHARNVGLDVATGDHVAFLDPDDTYENDTSLARLVSVIEAEGVDAALGMQMSLMPNGEVRAKKAAENPTISGRVAFGDTPFLWPCLHHHRFVFRRAFLAERGVRYSDHMRGQDVVFLARVMAENPRLFALSEPIYRHRIRSFRLSLTFRQTADRVAAFAEAAKVLAAAGLHRQAWHLLRSRFVDCIANMQAYAHHPGIGEIIGLWDGLSHIRGQFFAAGGFDDEDFEAQAPGAIVAAILGLSRDEFRIVLSSNSDRSLFAPAKVASNRTEAAWEAMERAGRLAVAAAQEAAEREKRREAEREAERKAEREALRAAQREAQRAARREARREAEREAQRAAIKAATKKKRAIAAMIAAKVKPPRGAGFAMAWVKIWRSHLFDAGWYLRTNPDVAVARMHPVTHFLNHGCSEGRDPGPYFNVFDYYSRRPDVARAGRNALLHYLQYGRAEAR